MRDLVGQTLGKYAISQVIGQGRLAVVYEATNTISGVSVALKLFRPELAHDQVFVRRCLEVTEAIARLADRNVITIYDFGWLDAWLFIEMDYLAAGTLQQRLASDTAQRGRASPLPLNSELAVQITRDVAAGLDSAHGHGIVHGDVKPSNILFTARDRAVVSDFGIALAALGTTWTQAGQSVGTPPYLSPEQVAGQPPRPASDVYALGVVCYEMLAGQPPVPVEPEESGPAPLRATSTDLSPAVDSVLSRALERDPLKRYRTAGELARALEEALQPAGARSTRWLGGAGAEVSGRSSDKSGAGLKATVSGLFKSVAAMLSGSRGWAVAAIAASLLVVTGVRGWLGSNGPLDAKAGGQPTAQALGAVVASPTNTLIPTRTQIPTRTPRPTLTPRPTATASDTPSPTATATTAATPSATPTPTRTPRPRIVLPTATATVAPPTLESATSPPTQPPEDKNKKTKQPPTKAPPPTPRPKSPPPPPSGSL
jgi:serine/threonine protein kinase